MAQSPKAAQKANDNGNRLLVVMVSVATSLLILCTAGVGTMIVRHDREIGVLDSRTDTCQTQLGYLKEDIKSRMDRIEMLLTDHIDEHHQYRLNRKD